MCFAKYPRGKFVNAGGGGDALFPSLFYLLNCDLFKKLLTCLRRWLLIQLQYIVPISYNVLLLVVPISSICRFGLL